MFHVELAPLGGIFGPLKSDLSVLKVPEEKLAVHNFWGWVLSGGSVAERWHFFLTRRNWRCSMQPPWTRWYDKGVLGSHEASGCLDQDRALLDLVWEGCPLGSALRNLGQTGHLCFILGAIGLPHKTNLVILFSRGLVTKRWTKAMCSCKTAPSFAPSRRWHISHFILILILNNILLLTQVKLNNVLTCATTLWHFS